MSSSPEMTTPLLSIILPVYNVESYIRECLGSIYDNNVSEQLFEIIAVNDGTPDESMKEIASFLNAHDNLIILEQNNQGLSAARMNGLSKAKGDYVWFIDSDDWLEQNAVDTIIKLLIETDCDVISTPLCWSYDDSSQNFLDYEVAVPWETDGETLMTEGRVPIWAATRYIIKRSLFQNPFLNFPEGLLHEDEYFGRVLMMLAKRVFVFNRPVYNYRQRNSSIMNTLSIRSSYDIISNYERLMSFAETCTELQRKKFMLHCQRLLVKSYMINRNRWKSREFKTFKRKNQLFILSEFYKLHKAYNGKEFFSLLFLTLMPNIFGRFYPKDVQ